uniref:Myeloid leukemia factor n=1 Tax=Heterorhabditis bacteriophora TaxID=37862 RepID=A0A1I7XA62_HETBA
MQRQMREMDRFMNSMIDPMFGMGVPRMGMIEVSFTDDIYGGQIPSRSRQVAHPFDPFGGFGFGGIFSAMGQLREHAMNDPNSHVYSHSTVMSVGEDGRPRVVENSMRKSGDVKETRRSLRDGDREEMSIGHIIGDRSHVIEKKRDKDGNVRKQQKFVNLDEG